MAERAAIAPLRGLTADAIAAYAAAATGEDRLWHAVERARALRREGRTDEAVRAWRDAAQLAEGLGLASEVERSLRSAAFNDYSRGHLAAAAARLDEVAAMQPTSPASRRLTDYYRAVVELGLGRYREATGRLAEVAEAAWLAGDDTTSVMAREVLAVALVDQGRLGEAFAVFDDPRTANLGGERRSTDRAVQVNNRGWLLLTAWQSGERGAEALDAARALFTEALALFGATPEALQVRTNLVWTLLLTGDLAGAEAAAAPLATDRTGPEPALVLGELHLRRGRLADAAAVFADAARRADEASSGLPTDSTWRARYGLGRVAAARGDTAAALAAYRDALAALDAVGAQTGVWQARARFFADRRPLVDDTATLLLAVGDPAGAFAVLDAAHGRALRALEARTRLDRLPPATRAAWEQHQSRYAAARAAFDAGADGDELLDEAGRAAWKAERERLRAEMVAAFEAADALLAREAPRLAPDAITAADVRAALPAGSALVMYATIGDVIHAFWLAADAIDDADATAAIDGITHAIVIEADLLAPFAGRLAALTHLYVVPGDVPAARELAQRPLDGIPLGARLSLSDLPFAGLLARRAPPRPGPLLVVADPRLDLPHAGPRRRDPRRIRARRPRPLLAGDAADRDAVRAALATAGALHYAGHGVARADTPWQAHLALAHGTTLTVADILTGAVPGGVVVLSGCRTGVQGALSRREAIGLADAFVAAGAGAVLATRRNVPDEAAARFIARFFAEGGLDRPGPALRATASAYVADGDELWTAFRLTGDPIRIADRAPRDNTERPGDDLDEP
ncbi:MAG: CHAT domain-containing protein [Myxococcales bacterium]|nr:CHAT domain-containing protein [Myxococcales bacterium]